MFVESYLTRYLINARGYSLANFLGAEGSLSSIYALQPYLLKWVSLCLTG